VAELRIGIVAGEASGDQLGIALMLALRKRYPGAVFEGVGGSLMIAEGFDSLFPMDALSVFGLVEPLKHLPQLLRIRRGLKQHFLNHPPDVFIGIDSPDFNIGLELSLRKKGIKTAHYVSPSVWAWRQGRVKKIARAVDLMLTLFPFEVDFYREHEVPVTYVGHPLADQLPLEPDTDAARQTLGLVTRQARDESSQESENSQVLTLMPGSRRGEVELLAPLFFDVAKWCAERYPGLQFVLPAASPERRQQIDTCLGARPELAVTVLDGQSHLAMEAADVVLLASGTTALEAMLLKKPMVVSYKTGWLTHAIISRMLKVPYVSLPNLLAGRELVPELLQDEATVEVIGERVLSCLQDAGDGGRQREAFDKLHRQLKCDASFVAAGALADLIERGQPWGE